LESGLQISGSDSNGQNTTINLRFNTVTDYLFTPMINEIRQAQFSAIEKKEDFDFSELKMASYKFANYTRHSLLPGERTLQIVWQPEMRAGRFKRPFLIFLNKVITRLVLPNHVLVLTDQELILIREDEHQIRKENYGGVWDFVPLMHVNQITIEDLEDGLLSFIVHLRDGRELRQVFPPERRSELEDLIRIAKIT